MRTAAPSFPDQPFALAVSGGGDSLGMLALAQQAESGRLTVLTVDHGLREGSAGDAAYVSGLCADRHIPYEILTAKWPGGPPTANIQARARVARYDLLGQACQRLGIGTLCTAHHADDQAETLLMRLARGSGLSGLSGVRETTALPMAEDRASAPEGGPAGHPSAAKGVTLYRPCLRMRSADLHAAARAAGFEPREDPSNSDPRHDRTRARRWLSEHPDLDPARLAETGANLADADAALDWLTVEILHGRVRWDGDQIHFDHVGLPVEAKRRVLHRLVGAAVRGGDAASAVQRLEAGASASLGEFDVHPGTLWTLRPSQRGG